MTKLCLPKHSGRDDRADRARGSAALPARIDVGVPPALPKVPASVVLGLRLYTWFGSSATRFRLAQRLAWLAARLWSPHAAWLRLPAITGWGLSKDFPRPADRPFRVGWVGQKVPPTASPAGFSVGRATHRQAEEEPVPASPPAEASLVDRFSQELLALGGAFNLCRESELPGRILELLSRRGLDRLLSWEADRLPAGLLEKIRSAGIELVHTPDASLKAGLTGALAGVADTGSLLLPGGPGRPLAASLLPEVHLAVLFARDIKENLPQAFRLPEVRTASSLAVVTGPSRTADIEMTLTIGVHGPREVHVFCLQEG